MEKGKWHKINKKKLVLEFNREKQRTKYILTWFSLRQKAVAEARQVVEDPPFTSEGPGSCGKKCNEKKLKD